MKTPLKITDEIAEKYYSGWKNKLARVYFYIREGKALFDEFRYVVIGISAVVLALKITGSAIFLWFAILFLIAMPILMVVGYIWVKHFKKSLDWFGVEHATHFTKYEITLLENILKELQKK